jgi:hypothetical protein
MSTSSWNPNNLWKKEKKQRMKKHLSLGKVKMYLWNHT